MKITSFAPFIISKNSEEVIKTFESLGFAKNHVKEDANSGANPATMLKDENGFHAGVAQSDNIPHDMIAIRINVDDFDAAYDEFIAMGFKNAQGDRIAHSKTDDACMMVSPTGLVFVVSKHIK